MVHGITYKKALSSAALLAVLAFALFAAGCGGGGGKAQASGGQNPNTAPGGGQGAPTPTNTAKSTGLKLEIQNDAGGTGPTTMVHDQKKTFKVVYSRSQANNLTASVEVRIDEYEWNGDETLVKPFKVKIKPGETKGHTTFTLTCTKSGNEWELKGNSGTTSVEDNPQEIQAENTSFSGVAHSAWHEINCIGVSEPKELVVYWYDRGAKVYDVTLQDGQSVDLTAELTLKAKVAKAETHKVNILERKVVLDKDLEIDIAAGQDSGEKDFKVTCQFNGTNFDLVGADGTSKNQTVFKVDGKHTSHTTKTLISVTITCEQKEEE